MNSKFPVLSAISVLLRIIGWIIAAIGLLAAFYSIYQLSAGHSHGGYGGYGTPPATTLLASAVGTILIGLCWVAASEIIGVLFAIEQNTRAHRPDTPPLQPSAEHAVRA